VVGQFRASRRYVRSSDGVITGFKRKSNAASTIQGRLHAHIYILALRYAKAAMYVVVAQAMPCCDEPGPDTLGKHTGNAKLQ
jgi:hypothetical protein